MWEIAGFQLHGYGLIIALAILVGYWLVEKKAQQLKLETNFLEKSFPGVVIAGIIGARVYHVVSDFHLYQDQLLNAFKIWEGGLSIIGAVIGAGLGVWWACKIYQPQYSIVTYLDLAIFGLPLAQVVGRVANYLNRELYGLPSDLPWAITIPVEKRLPGFESIAKYHPLFAYEMLLMAIFGVGVWWAQKHFTQAKWAQVGSGLYFLTYLAYYCLIRFCLDFLRLDKTLSPIAGLGSNQVVLGLILIVVLGMIGARWRRNYET